MEVIKVVPRGFCKGVIGAINIAKKCAKDYPDKPIYILGMLVHNKYVIEGLKTYNIITVDDKNKSRLELLDDIDEGVVIFTAHGVSDKVREKAKRKGLICVDASCSDVLKTKDLINDYLNKNYEIIYIGKKGHPEAMAIIEDSNHVHLIESIKDLKKLDLKTNQIFVTNQTTMSIMDVKNIYDEIKNRFPDAIICEEICNATRTRQEAILNLKDQNIDILFIIGDENSNNSKRLKDMGLAINIPKVYFINTINDIDFTQLNRTMKVAISAGASTPTYLTNQVIEALENFDQIEKNTKFEINTNEII